MNRRKSEPTQIKGRWNYSLVALIGIWAGATAIVTLMGPFGTFPSIGGTMRMVFWGSIIGMAMVLVSILRAMLNHFVSEIQHPLMHDAIVAPVFTLLYTPPLYFITDTVARGQQPFNMVQQGLVVLAISLGLIFAREVLMHTMKRSHGAPEMIANDEGQAATEAVEISAPMPEPKTSLPLIFERLPGELHGELLAISGSDHYVQIHTEHGTTSILLRFSDALREIDGVPGQRVHRSHWVADAAVAYVRRDGYRHFVVMQSGDELPVSRTYADGASQRWGMNPMSA